MVVDDRAMMPYTLMRGTLRVMAGSSQLGERASRSRVESPISSGQAQASRIRHSARGMAQVYLGVLNSLRPEAVGGRPEQGRAHFERAIALSDGRNLYAKTLFAEYYARLVFDQEMHDRLLVEVLAADPHAAGYTLTNVLAQDRARALQESGKDYF